MSVPQNWRVAISLCMAALFPVLELMVIIYVYHITYIKYWRVWLPSFNNTVIRFSDNTVGSQWLRLARPQTGCLLFLLYMLQQTVNGAILSNVLDESAHKNYAYFQHFKPRKKSSKHQVSSLIQMWAMLDLFFGGCLVFMLKWNMKEHT